MHAIPDHLMSVEKWNRQLDFWSYWLLVFDVTPCGPQDVEFVGKSGLLRTSTQNMREGRHKPASLFTSVTRMCLCRDDLSMVRKE